MLFRDVPGQSKIKQRLIQSVRENRVSHAQLFMGPEGSGKLALAIAYAQYINCRHRTPEDSCGVCPSCNKFGKLIHPDLHFLYPINKTKEISDSKVTHKDFIPAWREFLLENRSFITLPSWYDKIGIEKKQGFISADDSDSVNTTLAYKAYEAEYKVMIIWMAEKMNTTASNKLLKNLEEPPPKTLFILICENQEQVIGTIRSRAQLIKFPRIEDLAVKQALVEKLGVPDATAASIALQAEGNFRMALELADSADKETEAAHPEKEQFILLRDWMRKIYVFGAKQKEYDQLQEVITRLIGDGSREKQKEFLAYSLKVLRLCLQYHIGNKELVPYSGEELDFISKFAAFVHPRNIALFDSEINKAILHIERNANANFVFTDLSHMMARLIKIPSSAQSKKA